MFKALDRYNIHLSPTKSFIGYPSVSLLGQKVDALGLSTAVEKLEAITRLVFPATLSKLETYLGMTGYLRQYIPFFAAVSKPLQERKTLLGKQVATTVRGNARKKTAGRVVLVPTLKELNSFH